MTELCLDTLSREIDRAISHFQKGIASTVIGFAYAAILEAVAVQYLGPYLPLFLISVAMLIWGVLSDMETLTNQDHWFVFGVIFISIFIDLDSLILSVACLVGGFLVRYYLRSRGYWPS
jgi:hypothetical protein